MFPGTIPDYLRRDKGRSAEIRVYELLSERLPDAYACYWSRPWHRFTPDGREQDGEVDFVVAHAKLGLLAIEVKGGRVSCEGESGQWISKDRYDIQYRIKNPVDQARKGKFRLLELLKASSDWQTRYLNIRHGVILPDNARPKHALGADAPLELFAFGDDLQNLGRWVKERLQSGKTDAVGLGADGMEAIYRILATSFELRPHLARRLSEDIQKIERLTAEQSWIIEALEDNPQMSISGAAGTGKTVLALEKALRCATAGKRTLFVCFNNALSCHLQSMTGSQENLIVSSFHALCGSMAHRASISIPEAPSKQVYDRLLPEALLSSFDSNPDWRFDTIIVDEGQDFTDSWLDTLRLCLKHPDESEFYVFHDDNQKIFTAERAFLESLPQAKYRLNRNLRNTRAIHKVLEPWYDNRRVLPVGPEGVDVEWIKCRNTSQAYAKAATIAAELIKSRQLLPSQIAILTGKSRESCDLFKRDRVAGCVIKRADENTRGKELVGDTVRRYKGLESKCVLLVDIDHLTNPELIYVALSRPSVLLYVLGSHGDLERLKSGQE
jgi:hypothetical protein